MKLVTFSQAQAPHGVGDTRLVPDRLAKKLQAEGVLSASVTWPARVEQAPQKPVRPVVQPTRPMGSPAGRIAS
jgi:hypothetical protein